MNAREGRVESAAPNTGDWLLQSQSFKDWTQRKSFDQHHGFFWIQGNPGSGKSTLIKKAYSHIQSLSQDPTSIVAAFFFNARGDEMEKSPAGLFRTLLHYLCQRISALRAVVMRQYHMKRGLLETGWEWQFSELKELLSSSVTASVLGQRNLILCVDALDECDLTGAKSIIQFFEYLANCSIQEKTKFNVCLSSRYWPQFTVQHCFKIRVELENYADIANYIQQQMMTMQATVAQSDRFASLETKLKKKAQGTFLWVVLVVQELLSAHENGATLGDLNRMLQEVPPDLQSFYQYQIQSVEHDDSRETLSLFQCIFYSWETLTVTKLRYLLAFGRESFSSYFEWAQSDDYVVNDTQLEKRIRDKSKGLIEIVEAPKDTRPFAPSYIERHARRTKPVRMVQFIHQTVRDFLFKDGFKTIRGCETPNDVASGNEFLKNACFNYLSITDLQSIPVIDFRFYSGVAIQRKIPTLEKDHPLLMYAVDYLFVYAALAEENGISQDILRSQMMDNVQDFFERWKYLNDLICTMRYSKPRVRFRLRALFLNMDYGVQGPEARPLHIFAQYGLLVPGMHRLKEDPNICGGLYGYPLVAAAAEGHQDAVRYLLDLDADLQVKNKFGYTAYGFAAAEGHVEILEMLLEHPQSVITLEQRIDIARIINDRYDQWKKIIALLIPEVSIPVSAIDPICKLFRQHKMKLVPESFLLVFLDKCEAALLQHKRLWNACVACPAAGSGIIQSLLDTLESVEICEELLDALHSRTLITSNHDETDKVAMILFDRCGVKMSADFVNKVILLRNSSQLLNQLTTRGIKIPPLSCTQIMSALSNGSPESVGFFVQHAPDDARSDEMLLAVVQNRWSADQAVRTLLGIRKVDRVCDDMMTSCLQKHHCSLSVLKTFEDRWGTMIFSRNNLASMLSSTHRFNVDKVKFILERSEHFSLTESILCGAFVQDRTAPIVDLLLEFDPDFRLQDSFIAKTAVALTGYSAIKVYARHGKPLALTEEVVRAVANSKYGVEALNFIFRHDNDAKISDSMIREAIRSPHDSHLITWMLESDPSIRMQEDFLIEAASNTAKGALMFEALRYKGRISLSSPYLGVSDPPPAKRQRVSSNLSRPLRDKGTKSAPITTRVIEAAAANEDTEQRRKLLSLFQKWDVLTDEDVELFYFSDEDDAASLSDHHPSTQSDYWKTILG